jgi:type IV secretory pathway VirJ component
MKRLFIGRLRYFIAVTSLLGVASSFAKSPTEKPFRMGPFGEIPVFTPAAGRAPERLVLLLSDAAGWTAADTRTAKALAAAGHPVAALDTARYLKKLGHTDAKCLYPAADFETLSQRLQRRLGGKDYRTPLLLGTGDGAALAYATLAQAPPNTFHGGVGRDFCPRLDTPKAFCKGAALELAPVKAGARAFLPARKLERDWQVLRTRTERRCAAEATRAFVEATGHGKWVVGTGDGQAEWLAAVESLEGGADESANLAQLDEAVADLPLIELPADKPDTKKPLVVIFSGDGGWANIDKELSTALQARGFSVVGWNSLRYFWTERTPEATAADLARVIKTYLAKWKLKRAYAVGYSRGADILPFALARLPADPRKALVGAAFLGLSPTADFEFHLSDWLADEDEGLPVKPELQKLAPLPLLCIYGKDETESLCAKIQDLKHATAIEKSGGHHFDGDTDGLAELIENATKRR